MDKYCVESPQYGKDELKRLHFYCENCGKEILRDKQICYPAPKDEGEKCKTHPNCSHNTDGRSLDKPCSISFPQPPAKDEPNVNNYFGLEDILNEWIKQGRSEEAIWGVKNFLTGIGGIKISQLLEEAEARGKKWNISWNEHLKQINLTKAQARLSTFEEIEKWADIYMPSELVKYPYDCGYRQALQDLQSFIKENKTKI